MSRLFERWYSGLTGFDPGLVRLEKAGLAMLSFLSAWIIMREIVRYFAGELQAPVKAQVGLFAPVLALICSLVISDLRPADRRNTLFLSLLPLCAVLASFALLPVIPWLYSIILLILFFLSYYFRRYGIRYTELFILAAFTFYFAALLKITTAVLPWYLLAALISVFSIYLWQFVLLRYSPRRLLHRTDATYYRLAAMIVAEITGALQKTPLHPDWKKRLESELKRISHCRKVIESEFVALTPPVWTQERLNQLRIDFYNAEQGVTVMIQASSDLNNQSGQIPEDLRKSLLKTLTDFQQVLFKVAAPQSVENLEKQITLLRHSIDDNIGDSSASAWAVPMARLITGGSQLNHAVKDARELESTRRPLVPVEPASTSPPPVASDKKPGVISPKPTLSGRLKSISLKTLHPTTLLGFQAFLAVFLAMLVTYFVELDHSNWVFWTAFVVIAGSTGESLRRMSFRVAGTIIGVVIGILIFLSLDNLNAGKTPIVGLVAACLFLAAYFVDTSYLWMILWINIAVTLLFTGLGGTVVDILVSRPLNTFIGASIAALVVIFILPVRTKERFRRSLAAFLKALDKHLAGYYARLMGKASLPDIDATGIQLNAAFAQLEHTFPSMALEFNPLSRAQNPLLELSTTLQSLKMDLLNMTQDVSGEFTHIITGETTDLLSAIQERIHKNIEATMNILNKKPAEEARSLSDLYARANQISLLEQLLTDMKGEAFSEKQILVYLARVNQAVCQIASGVGTN